MSDWKKISPLWDLSDAFTVREAAALIAGFDPNAVDPSGKYFRNLETDYTDSNGIAEVAVVLAALTKAIAAPYPRLRAQLRHDAEPRYVFGRDNLIERGYWKGEDVFEVKDFDETSYVAALPDLSKTTIDREHLVTWLRARGYTAGFFFHKAGRAITDSADLPDTLAAPAGLWPWGNHHTKLLGHLEAAAREFWVGYDPQNAKATAPKNETVIAWLEAPNVPGQRKKVSNQMASAIASILRPDNLPTGPRK